VPNLTAPAARSSEPRGDLIVMAMIGGTNMLGLSDTRRTLHYVAYEKRYSLCLSSSAVPASMLLFGPPHGL
jgi:hypothetical protein